MNGYFIQQHRYNSVKTGKSRTVSTGQKGPKALTTALKDTPVFQSRNPGMGRWTIPGFFCRIERVAGIPGLQSLSSTFDSF